jgi:hypothetical protein
VDGVHSGVIQRETSLKHLLALLLRGAAIVCSRELDLVICFFQTRDVKENHWGRRVPFGLTAHGPDGMYQHPTELTHSSLEFNIAFLGN